MSIRTLCLALCLAFLPLSAYAITPTTGFGGGGSATSCGLPDCSVPGNLTITGNVSIGGTATVADQGVGNNSNQQLYTGTGGDTTEANVNSAAANHSGWAVTANGQDLVQIKEISDGVVPVQLVAPPESVCFGVRTIGPGNPPATGQWLRSSDKATTSYTVVTPGQIDSDNFYQAFFKFRRNAKRRILRVEYVNTGNMNAAGADGFTLTVEGVSLTSMQTGVWATQRSALGTVSWVVADLTVYQGGTKVFSPPLVMADDSQYLGLQVTAATTAGGFDRWRQHICVIYEEREIVP